MSSLLLTESWMLLVITHQDGVVAGANQSTARNLIDDPGIGLDHVVKSTSNWSAIDRLGIYWNAYFARLQDCLRDEFPVLRINLGEELFDDFVSGYLEAQPPSSYTLARLGANFANYLSETRPVREDCTDIPNAPDWADFIADLAAFEWGLSDAFDGPGTEHLKRSLPNSLDHLSDQSDDLQLTFAPCLHLHAYQFPVHAYHAAVKAGDEPEHCPPRQTFLAITRQDFIVKYYPLGATEYSLLKRLLSGESLSEALEGIWSEDDSTMQDVDDGIKHWFVKWTRAGFIMKTAIPTT
jgi:hypothetical protein